LDSILVGREANKTDAKPEHEKKADKWASEALVPSARLSEFVRNCGDRFSKQAIRQFAELIGVHPGVVVGQLQHKDSISYSHSREMLMDIRDIITETAVTDGWGKRFDAAGL
jgi:HTH-type transcriptional regulator/antitoxin HigA